jgi:DNA mismatch repair protein MutS2
MKTAVAVAELILESGATPAPSGKSRRAGTPAKSAPKTAAGAAPQTSQPVSVPEAASAGVRTPDSTLDVRGERADEAVDTLDRFIDQSLLSMRAVVFVIHGHGTGALRAAVRSHLASHRAVANWRPGERAEGGDGVTVAWLDVG